MSGPVVPTPRTIPSSFPVAAGFDSPASKMEKVKKEITIRRKRISWKGAAIVAASFLLLYLIYHFAFPKRTTTHLTAQVKRGTFDVVVVETGELQSKRSIAVTTPVLASGGRSQLAIQYLAPEGTTIDSGTLVVQFDPADAVKNMSDKQNDLKLSHADLEKLKVQQGADESEAKMNYENAKLSFELAKLSNEEMKFESESKQRESQLELRKAELAFQQAEEKVKSKSAIQKSEIGNLELKIAQQQSALERVQEDMERLAVKAPAGGLIVYQRSWNTGKKLTKGDQVWGGQPVVQLPDLSHMQAVLQVNEVDISKVRKQQNVEVTLDAFPDKKFTGKVEDVASIGNAKENNPSVKVFEVTVDLSGTDSVLRPGMTVSARIAVSKIDNVLSVPIESVFEDNGKTVVYVDNNGDFERREVKLGAKNDSFIVVTQGVKEGEHVALADPTLQKDDKSSASKDAKPNV